MKRNFLDHIIKLWSGQVYSSIYYHLVWGTKNRESYILKQFKKKLYSYIGGVISSKGWFLIACGGTCNHIHLLIRKKPTDAIPDVVCCIKTNSSKYMKENFIKDFSWQKGYSVFTVDTQSLSRLKDYISKQESHHRHMPFEEELKLLFKRYNIGPEVQD